MLAEIISLRSQRHFNLLFHNCADFSRVVLDIYLPHSIHRNFIADVGLMTPKQVNRPPGIAPQSAARTAAPK